MPENNANKRFYEKDPTVSKLVKLLDIFPTPVQTIILEGMIEHAERAFKAKELLHALRTLGSEKVLALFQSKKKRRRYDADPTYHQAMNYLLILSDEDRLFFSTQIMTIMNFFSDYLKACKLHKQETSTVHFKKLKDTYIHSGENACRKLLDNIILSLSLAPRIPMEAPDSAPPQPTAEQQTSIQQDSKGMRIIIKNSASDELPTNPE